MREVRPGPSPNPLPPTSPCLPGIEFLWPRCWEKSLGIPTPVPMEDCYFWRTIFNHSYLYPFICGVSFIWLFLRDFSLSLLFSHLTVIWISFCFFFFPCWGLLGFLDLWTDNFNQIWKTSANHVIEYFLPHEFVPLLLNNTYVRWLIFL